MKKIEKKIIAICKEDIKEEEEEVSESEEAESEEPKMDKGVEAYLEDEAQKIDAMLDRLLKYECHHPYGGMRKVIKKFKIR